MNKIKLAGICVLTSSLALSGCVARTYNLTRDRIDQDISATSGNRGYITGTAPAEPTERKTTRTTRVFEIELGFTKPSQAKCPSVTPMESSMEEPAAISQEEAPQSEDIITKQGFESYTVGKNDTLQKISEKFYGTTKKWPKIYEANKNILRSPDKLYAGQTLRIPSSPELKTEPAKMAEPEENLK
ncbi:MAG: LysM peptidoglycan-binding domain-containing protein [Candidatus Omnitrophica bacterium]|nr:LysM peptidoglycan-binding domain-containing protein [Candidatus Omnitrophota bacterium]